MTTVGIGVVKLLVRAALAGVALTLVLPAAAASAHAEPVSITPETQTTLSAAPGRVEIKFSEELAPSSNLSVLDPEGSPLSVGSGGVDLDDLDRRTLYADLSGLELEPGTYTVRWEAVSAEDDDRTDGSWWFAIADEDGVVPGGTGPVAIDGGDGFVSSSTIALIVAVLFPLVLVPLLVRRRPERDLVQR